MNDNDGTSGEEEVLSNKIIGNACSISTIDVLHD